MVSMSIGAFLSLILGILFLFWVSFRVMGVYYKILGFAKKLQGGYRERETNRHG